MNVKSLEQQAKELDEFMKKLSSILGDDCVVIGGLAVRAYGAKRITLDGDAMISHRAFGEIREEFQITTNPRLHKSQFISPTGHDIDLYTEHQHRLKVAFDELQLYSEERAGMRVACPEHLLVLKLEAAHARQHSQKGAKDREDLLVLLLEAPFKHPDLLHKYLTKEDWTFLESACKDPLLVKTYFKGNAKKAADALKHYNFVLNNLRKNTRDVI